MGPYDPPEAIDDHPTASDDEVRVLRLDELIVPSFTFFPQQLPNIRKTRDHSFHETSQFEPFLRLVNKTRRGSRQQKEGNAAGRLETFIGNPREGWPDRYIYKKPPHRTMAHHLCALAAKKKQ